MRARRELWTALGAAPDELLSRASLTGDRFDCIMDLLFRVTAVEDGWMHEDILRLEPINATHAGVKDTDGGATIAPLAGDRATAAGPAVLRAASMMRRVMRSALIEAACTGRVSASCVEGMR